MAPVRFAPQSLQAILLSRIWAALGNELTSGSFTTLSGNSGLLTLTVRYGYLLLLQTEMRSTTFWSLKSELAGDAASLLTGCCWFVMVATVDVNGATCWALLVTLLLLSLLLSSSEVRLLVRRETWWSEEFGGNEPRPPAGTSPLPFTFY